MYVTIFSSTGRAPNYVKENEAELGHSHFYRSAAYGEWAELSI